MKKKLLSALLAGTMLLGLAACGDSAGDPTKTPANDPTNPPAASDKVDTPADPAEVWPTDDVTIYVASSAGSANDLLCRIVTGWLEKRTGKTFTVINQTDGGGVTAYETVRNAEPDGLTLFANHTGICVQYILGQYDQIPPEVFTPVGAVAGTGNQAYVARADAPYNNLDELQAYAKEHPGEVKWGVKLGNATHLSVTQIAMAMDVDIKMMEAGDSNDKLAGILGGNIDIGNMNLEQAFQYVDSGDLKIVFTNLPYEDKQNCKEWKDGLLAFNAGGYNLLWGPKGMDEATLKAIGELFAECAADAEVAEQIEKLGQVVNPCDYITATEFVQNDYNAKFEAATAAGINKRS